LAFICLATVVDANHDDDDPQICKHGGGGVAFPLFGNEYSWPVGLQVTCYFLGLIYMFLGVSIIADLFMEAIEVITSETKTIKVNGQPLEISVWNATVANLTLMALGSSAPEILLNVIEITTGEFFSGALGPGTIVGSAAFNLLCIIAVCIIALPDGDGRRIAEPGVFVVTAVSSLFAYLWILVILQLSSPNIVEVWEGILTFLFFPMLVYVAYGIDQGWLKSKQVTPDGDQEQNSGAPKRRLSAISGGGLTPQQCKELVRTVANTVGTHTEGEKTEEVIKLLAMQQVKLSRAAMRVNATRMMTGGKRVMPSQAQLTKVSEQTTALLNAEAGHVVQFKSDIYMVSEGDGKLDVCVTRTNPTGVSSVQFETVRESYGLFELIK
jgi:solute carrier family 8 (sodium/calcium exchanger)